MVGHTQLGPDQRCPAEEERRAHLTPISKWSYLHLATLTLNKANVSDGDESGHLKRRDTNYTIKS